MNDRIGILIVDDHFVVREGLRSIIRREPDLEVAGEASNGIEAEETFDRILPDVTIIDLRMPVRGGVETIRAIRKKHPGARILVLSNFDGDEDIHASIQAGAVGYLLKHSSGDQIVPAVRALMCGGRWIPREVASQLDDRGRYEILTAREREILGWIARGEANKQIAGRLSITEHTVKSHMKNILAKLHVRDRTEAVTAALRRGIIHLPDR